LSISASTNTLQPLRKKEYAHAPSNFHSHEQIDGLLFAQIDEDMLAQDLGVTSKLHQKKIMLHIQLRKESLFH
jgi:hypothetical protein